MMLFFVLFSCACELRTININVHMITLQLLVNQECGTTNLGSRRNSLDLLATTRVITCTCKHINNCTKIKETKSATLKIFRKILFYF